MGRVGEEDRAQTQCRWSGTFAILVAIALSILMLLTCDSALLLDTVQKRVSEATAPLSPRLTLRRGSTVIRNGDTFAFGHSEVNKTLRVQFSIRNQGTAALQLTGDELVRVLPSGTTPDGVFSGQQPTSPIVPGGTVNFDIDFRPKAETDYTGTVEIESDDPHHERFIFHLTGTGTGDITGPVIVSTFPVEFEPDFPNGESIWAEFDEPIQPGSITTTTFRLYDLSASQTVLATRNYNPVEHKALLIPEQPLVPGHEYRLTVTTGIQDEVGNPMDQDYEWRFIAKASEVTVGDLVIRLSGLDNDSGTVTAYILALDNGEVPIETLNRFNFVVREKPGAEWLLVDPQYESLTSQPVGESGSPKTFSIIVDNSGSTTGPPLASEKTAISNFVFNPALFKPGDAASIWRFSEPRLVHDFSGEAMSLQMAVDAITAAMPGTAAGVAYDAAEHHFGGAPNGMKAVILNFDGISSDYRSPWETQALSIALGVPVYPLGFYQANPADVATMATAGYSEYFPGINFHQITPGDYEALYANVVAHMNKGYAVTWNSLRDSGSSRPYEITVRYASANGSWYETVTGSYTLP